MLKMKNFINVIILLKNYVLYNVVVSDIAHIKHNRAYLFPSNSFTLGFPF